MTALIALLGVIVGSAIVAGIEASKVQASRRESDRTALREAAALFVASSAEIERRTLGVSSSSGLEELGEIESLRKLARAQYEVVRLLSGEEETQRAGRMALRHLYSLRSEKLKGIDPRAGEFQDPPDVRYHDELANFFRSVRRELGLKVPDSVFLEPFD